MLVEKDQADFPAQWKNHLNRTVILGAHRDEMKRKRMDYDTVMQVEANREAAVKRRRLRQARNNRLPDYRTLPIKQYVARTPGGQIVADNHYFDSQTVQASQALTSISANWTNTRIEFYNGATGVTAMGTLFCPTQGDDIGQRQGRRCFVKHIRIQGTFVCPVQAAQTGSDAPLDVRYILVQDKQTNATSLTGDLVIASGYQAPALYMHQSAANFGRFKVLKDKTITFQNPALGTDGASTLAQNGLRRTFKISAKINEWVDFNATNGGTVADIVNNSWHLLAATNGAALAVTIAAKCRVVFQP